MEPQENLFPGGISNEYYTVIYVYSKHNDIQEKFSKFYIFKMETK